MKDGFWINYERQDIHLIDEHERWLRRGNNAARLGVPQRIRAVFDDYEPVRDRDEFLRYIMKQLPLMRVRGHGSFSTFEHAASPLDMRPHRAILAWGEVNAGPALLLSISNLRTNTGQSDTWARFRSCFPSSSR